MRAIRLFIVCLLSLVLLSLWGNRFFQSLTAAGQASTLAAPTQVTATDNAYSTKVGVSWDAIRDAALYRIFRNIPNDSASAVVVGTTSDAVFFDNSGVPGQVYSYWVRAENGSDVSSLSQPDQGVRANGNIAGPVLPLNPPPAPPGNPVTAAKAYLGKTLFWDEQLSSTRTVACGTCHFATNGGSDSRSIVGNARSTNPGADGIFGTTDDVFGSPGIISSNSDFSYNWSAIYGFREQVTGRKSRSYIDAGYSNSLFWDGRATATFTDPIGGGVVLQNGAALESQVLGPPVNSEEMAHSGRSWNDVAVRVSQAKPLALSPSIPAGLKAWISGRSYPELFAQAFGTPEITPARIAMAIATFERTVYSDQTPFDKSVSQIAQLSAAETRGQGVFNQSRCNVCHAGTLFTDNQFHNIGVRPQFEDTGRFQVTANTNNIGEFRTPGLRNVGLRAPYMHNGRFATLEDVIEFYNRGGDFNAPNINHNLIQPLNLSPQQKSDLAAFLRGALTDPRVAAGSAPFDRPALYSESNRVPQITGSGSPGSGGNIPQVTAIEPPLVGNPGFTIGLSNALGGAQAVLVIDGNDPGVGPTVPGSGSFARASINLSGSGSGQGFGSVSLKIPDSPALVGATFFGRWYVLDSGASGGVAVSPAFKMTVFGEASVVPNPILAGDDAGIAFFVRQQYLDFLGREPEPGEPWSNILRGCQDQFNLDSTGSSAQCDRIMVSGSFFGSPEFLTKGVYTILFYRAALNRLPEFAEFAPDLLSVTGATSAETNAKRAAFADNFVLRTEFVNSFAGKSNADYVNTLMARYGATSITTPDPANPDGPTKLTFTSAELINRLNAGTLTRAQALRAIVQSDEVTGAEAVKTFVAAQYYGYLRRTPETQGFTNWVNYLHAHPGDYRTMINGFMNSAEYRSRFGAT